MDGDELEWCCMDAACLAGGLADCIALSLARCSASGSGTAAYRRLASCDRKTDRMSQSMLQPSVLAFNRRCCVSDFTLRHDQSTKAVVTRLRDSVAAG